MTETAALPTSIGGRVVAYIDALNESSSARHNFTTRMGRKYIKVIDNGSVHAFIEISSGFVYKPAGHAKPAEHIRFYLMRDGSYRALLHHASQPEAFAGGYLYIR